MKGGGIMKLKLACPDFAFPLLEHEQSLDLIKVLEFEGVDVGLFEGRSHLQPSGEFRDPVRSGRRLKGKLDELGLVAADVFLQTDNDPARYTINHPETRRRSRARDWFLKTLEYSSACGCRHVTILPGMLFDDEPYSESLGRSVDELAWRMEKAVACRIVLSVEPHIRSVMSTTGRVLGLIRRVPGLTLTLDYGHFAVRGIPDPVVEPLIEHAAHFHLRGGRRGRLQESFKRNTIDFRRILERMAATGYRGWICIEYVRMDWGHCDESDNISEIILFRDYLRSLKL